MGGREQGDANDVAGHRLPAADYGRVFCDIAPPLNLKTAQIESSRCYYCYDAPCINACPTGIDIPSFIRKIGNGNVKGAAVDILSANIMGGTCARVCPVETLCQEACVREKSEQKPVAIGHLQRFATDAFFASGQTIFTRGEPTGKRVAVVGAGPAGLSCAHKLATLGHDVVVFEARQKPGGLNEHGIAPYKVVDEWAAREVAFIVSIGGIELRHGQALGMNVGLAQLRKDYDAVFLGMGLGDVNALDVPGHDLLGVIDAAKFIEKIRQAEDLSALPVGRHVIVIGGGNTAIDIAIQMKRLGAEFVTMVYRRGEQQMGATWHERELAQKNGVLLKTWAMPHKILGYGEGVNTIEFEYTELSSSGKLVGTREFFTLRADQVFTAIGQNLVEEALKGGPTIKNGKIVVNDRFETSVAGVFAGGDCVVNGEDLTVTAVQHGKLAALSIDERLAAGRPAKKGNANG